MNLVFGLSTRMAFSRTGQISRVISLLSVAGIGLAVAALLIVMAVVNGFREQFARGLLQAEPHVVVRTFGRPLFEESSLAPEQIERISGVVRAAPFLSQEVLVACRGKAAGGLVRGVDSTKGLLPVPGTVISGSWPGGSAPGLRPLCLGKELALRLQAGVRDTVVLATFLTRGGVIQLRAPRVQQFLVGAILDTGVYQYNNSICLVDLENAQEFYRQEGLMSGIEVELDDPLDARHMARAISDSLGYPFYSTSWQELNAAMFSMLALQKKALFLILTLMIVVAAANVVSGLTALVTARRKEIGVLMAMGVSRSGIVRIFFATGVVVGIVGLGSGLILAAALVVFANTTHLVDLAADVYQIDYLPLRLELMDVALVSLSAILVAVGSTVAPARRAGRLLPIEILRYE